MSSTPLLNSHDAAEYLNCSVNYIVALAQSGQLRGIWFGRRWKFSQESLENFINASSRSRS
jgi:excisionase family DNA binding protein